MADASAKKSEFAVPNSENGGLELSESEVEMIFTSHNKNIEAMMQASRLALDGVQAIWRRQLDFIHEAVEGLTTLAGDFAQPPGPLNQKFARHADYSRRALEKNLANARELTGLATEATTDAMNIINQRVREGIDEMRRLRNRQTRTSTESAPNR
jgi:phasin family protein